MACAPSEGSDYPGYPPSQIRVFFVRLKKAMLLSYPLSAQRRLWSDWADAQAGLSLRWVHMHFFWFCHELAQITQSTIWPNRLLLLFVHCFTFICIWLWLSWFRGDWTSVWNESRTLCLKRGLTSDKKNCDCWWAKLVFCTIEDVSYMLVM